MTKTRLKFSSEIISKVLDLRRSYMGLDEISLKTDLSTRNVREILLSELSEEEYRKTKPANKLSPRDRIMINLTKEGKTLEEIGNRFNVSRERVRQILKKHGIEAKHALKVRKKKKQNNIDQNINKLLFLVQQGMTEKEIIEKLGIDINLFKEIKTRLIKTRRLPRGSVNSNRTNIDMEIRHEHILALRKDGLKNPAIAKYLGVSTQTIHRDVRKMKLKGIDVPGSRQHWNEPILALEREDLYNTILKKRQQGFTLTEIAEDLDMPYRKIQDRFNEMKIMGIKTL